MKTGFRASCIGLMMMLSFGGGIGRAAEPIKVGIYDLHPLVELKADHRNHGFLIELLEIIADQEDWRLEFVRGSLADCRERLDARQIDLLLAAPYTKKDTARYDFTRETAISTWAQVYVKDTDIQSFIELSHRTVGLVRDEPYNAELRHIIKRLNIECRYMEFNHAEDVFQALQNGWIDVGVVDRLFGIQAEKTFGLERTPIIFAPIELRFAVLKNHHQYLIEAIDYHLEAQKKNPQSPYYDLMGRLVHTKETLSIPVWLKWGLPITLGVSVLLAGLNLLLRRQVHLKTEELSRKNVLLLKEVKDKNTAVTALRQSEEKYRTILESIDEGYYEVDLEGNFTFINDSMCRIFGYGRGELEKANFRHFMDARTASRVRESFRRVRQAGKTDRGFEWEFVGKDGQIKYVEASAAMLKDSDGDTIGFRGILRDVTPRKLDELEKARLERKLKHAQKMEAVGTLAGGVAHDLNNILSGIVSYPELLLMDLPEEGPIRESLLTIKNSGVRAAAIVQDLLTLARRGVPVMEIVNLNTIVSDYLNSPEFRKLAQHHPAMTIDTRLSEALLNIKGSPIHLAKTVMNLVANAVEALQDEGRVVISTANRYVDAPIRGYDDVEEGEYVVFAITDTGIGISEEDQERIFEPFYTKKVMGRSGTGLGMAVVWGTVKDHCGYIDLTSTVGKGTTFTLYFPATRQPAKTAATVDPTHFRGSGETILVVDDVAEQRQIAVRMLNKLDYHAVAVSSGEAAVAYLETQPVELVILDMIMPPGIDGLDTYKQIRRRHPHQKAIIVSGYAETDRVKEAQKLGVGAYIRKPFLMETLGMAVRKEIARPTEDVPPN